jgi:hypothetical protein
MREKSDTFTQSVSHQRKKFEIFFPEIINFFIIKIPIQKQSFRNNSGCFL